MSNGMRDGPALTALFSNPYGLWVSAEKDMLFISDRYNNAIRAIFLANATVITIGGASGQWGHVGDGGAAVTAQFDQPLAVVFDDTASILYIADTNNHVVRAILANGTAATIAGVPRERGSGPNGPALACRLNGPRGVAYDSARRLLYIADTENNGIRLLSFSTGNISSLIGGPSGAFGDGGLASAALFKQPYGLLFHPLSGSLYFCDTGNSMIRVIQGPSNPLTAIIVSAFKGPTPAVNSTAALAITTSLAVPQGVDSNCLTNTLYVSETDTHVVWAMTRDGLAVRVAGVLGVAGYSGDGGPALNATLRYPLGIAFSPLRGVLYILNLFNYAVRALNTTSASITTLAGGKGVGYSGDGGQASNATLRWTHALALDDAGSRLFLGAECAIRWVNLHTGTISRLAGSGNCAAPTYRATSSIGPMAGVGRRGDTLPGFSPLTLSTLNAPLTQHPSICASFCANATGCRAWTIDTAACSWVASNTSNCWLMKPSAANFGVGMRYLKDCAISGTMVGAPVLFDGSFANGDGGLASEATVNYATRLMAWDAGNSTLFFGERTYDPDDSGEFTLRAIYAPLDSNAIITTVGARIGFGKNSRWNAAGSTLQNLSLSSSDGSLYVDSASRKMFVADKQFIYTVDLASSGYPVTPLAGASFTRVVGSYAGDGSPPGQTTLLGDAATLTGDCGTGIFFADRFNNAVRQITGVFPGEKNIPCPAGYTCPCGRRPQLCTNSTQYCSPDAIVPSDVAPGYKSVFGPSPLGKLVISGQFECAKGEYCSGGLVYKCPRGTAGSFARQVSAEACMPAAPGSFQPLLGASFKSGGTVGTLCPPGYWSSGRGAVHCTPCAANTANGITGATSASVCARCTSNSTFAPPGSATCLLRSASDTINVQGGALILLRDQLLDSGDKSWIALALLYAVPIIGASAIPLVLLVVRKSAPTLLTSMFTLFDINPLFTAVPVGAHPVMDPSPAGGAIATFFVGVFVSAAVAQVLQFIFSNTVVTSSLLPIAIDNFAQVALLPPYAAVGTLLPFVSARSGITVVVDTTGALCGVVRDASIDAFVATLNIVTDANTSSAFSRHIVTCADCLLTSVSSITLTFDGTCTAAVVTAQATGAWGRLSLASIYVPDVTAALKAPSGGGAYVAPLFTGAAAAISSLP